MSKFMCSKFHLKKRTIEKGWKEKIRKDSNVTACRSLLKPVMKLVHIIS